MSSGPSRIRIFLDGLSRQELADRLDLAMEGARLGIWDWDLRDNSVQFDRRWCEMLGLEHEAVPQVLDSWSSRVHPDDIDQCFADIRGHVDGKTEYYENVHRMLHADGGWRYILDRGRISGRDAEGNPIRMTGTHLDVTAFEAAKRALADKQAQLVQLVRYLPTPVAMLDRSLNYIAVSGSWLTEHGLVDGEWQGAPSNAHLARYSPILGTSLVEALAGRPSRRGEQALARAGGAMVWLRWHVHPWRTDDGEIGGVIVHIEDITNEVEHRLSGVAEGRLSALGMMAGGIAHEINTPLHVMTIELGFVGEELGGPTPDLDEVRDSLSTMEDAVRQMQGIVRSMRVLTHRSEEAPPSWIAVAELFADIAALCNSRARALGVDFTVDPPPAVSVQGHRSEIAQVLVNLVSNSLDAVHGQPDAWTRLGAKILPDGVVLYVVDNGPGVAPDDVARIMDPFFTTKPIGQGTGLGLSISHALARRSNAQLRLASRVGPTEFTVTFPLECSDV